ncbi:MAG TPA: hypothetical protein VK733_11075, partial [Gemmatimonadaceae bacterium]|nr:hypothetical protein [Gemmatimonadaceae bacterium]
LSSGTVGIHITNSMLTGCSNNLITESAQHAILIEAGSDQTVLMANRCVSNGKSDPDRFATLAVRGSRDVTVIGNVFGGVVSPKVSQIDSDAASHVNASANVLPAVAKP